MANDTTAALAYIEMAEALINANVVDGVTWVLERGFMPDSPDRVLVVSPAGGQPTEIKNGLQHPQVQLRARGAATEQTDVMLKIQSALDALTVIRGQVLGSGDYAHILPQSAIQFLGQDKNGRYEYAVTVEAARTPV